MHRIILAPIGALVFALCVSAQSAVATATSMGYFNLRGATVLPYQGVPVWPVMPGDVIIAGDLPVTVTFLDGSSVTLGTTSKGKIEIMGGSPTFELDTGIAQYSLRTPNAIKLMASNESYTPSSLRGSYTSDLRGKASAPLGELSEKGVVFSGLAIVGFVLGLGLWKSICSGSSVSPSE